MGEGLLDLTGRIVVVSGAGGGGIGTTVTELAARCGATVLAVSRSRDNLDQHVAPLADQGLAVVPVVADAATDAGIATVLERARSADGRLYGLVNIAGGAAPDTWMPATRVTRQAWRDLFTQNLETMFFMSQAVAAELRAHGLPGSIVSLSSISGMNSAPYHVAYGTAKAAVVAATRTMAAELGLPADEATVEGFRLSIPAWPAFPDTVEALKRLRKRGNSIALEAANPAYETRIFGPDRVRIQGKLVAMIHEIEDGRRPMSDDNLLELIPR